MVCRLAVFITVLAFSASCVFAQTTRPAALVAGVSIDPNTFQLGVDADLTGPPDVRPVATTPTVDPTVSRFTSPELCVQMDVPNEWVGYVDKSTGGVKFYGPSDANAKFRDCFTVACVDLGAGPIPNLDDPSSFNIYKDKIVTELGQTNPGWYSAVIDRAVVDSLPALRVVGTATDGNVAVKAMHVRVVHDHKLYVFEFVATPDRFDYTYLAAKRVIRSVKFDKTLAAESSTVSQATP